MFVKLAILILLCVVGKVVGEKTNETLNQTIICPLGCVCDNVQAILSDVDNVDNIGGRGTFSNPADDGILSAKIVGSSVLNELTIEYHLYLTGIAVVCPRHNFTMLPALQESNLTANFNNTGDTEDESISVLMLRCGLLMAITAQNLPDNLQVADFSHNRIRFISGEAMRKLGSLEVLNLQYNLLTHVAYPNGIMRIPPAIPRPPAILLEGNVLTCSCSLFTIVTQHLGKDKGSCWLRSDENQTKSDKDNSGPVAALPLHFFTYISSELSRYCFDQQMSFKNFIESQNEHLLEYKSLHGDMNSEELLINRTAFKLERRFRGVDYPLLITMSGWFLLVFVGLFKFVRSNSIDYEMHKDYLSKLDGQENTAIGPITVIPGNRHARVKRSKRLVSTDSSVSLLR